MHSAQRRKGAAGLRVLCAALGAGGEIQLTDGIASLLADELENFNRDLVRGLLRRYPDLDLVGVQEASLSETDGPAILAWAAKEQRVLLTHDVNTMTRFAIEQIERGEPMAGVFFRTVTAPALPADRVTPYAR